MTIREMIETLEQIEKEKGSNLLIVVNSSGSYKNPDFYLKKAKDEQERDKLVIVEGLTI